MLEKKHPQCLICHEHRMSAAMDHRLYISCTVLSSVHVGNKRVPLFWSTATAVPLAEVYFLGITKEIASSTFILHMSTFLATKKFAHPNDRNITSTTTHFRMYQKFKLEIKHWLISCQSSWQLYSHVRTKQISNE